MLKKQHKNQVLLWGHVIAFLLTLLMSMQFGVSNGSMLCIGFVVAYSIPALLSKRLIRNWCPQFAWILLIAALVMAFGITQNLITYTSDGYTFELPSLKNDFQRDYYAAIELLKGNEIGNVNLGHPLFISYIFKIMGYINIIPLLIINMFFILSTICISSRICAILLANDNIEEQKLFFYGAILTSSISMLLLQGTLLLKDAGVCFAVSCIGYSLANIYHSRIEIRNLSFLFLGLLILLIFKSSIAWFILIGLLILAYKSSKKQILCYTLIGIFCLAVICIGTFFRTYSDIALIQGDSKTAITESILMLENTEKYGQIIPEYYESHLYRIILLPFTSVVQYIMPIPWHMFNHLDLGQFHWYGHLSIFWYFTGGAMIGFYVFQIFRKSGKGLNRWALWWIICYMGIAYYSAGTVARYYLPFIPLGVPLALHFLYSVKNGVISNKSAKTYWFVYAGLMIVALALSYWFLEIK